MPLPTGLKPVRRLTVFCLVLMLSLVGAGCSGGNSSHANLVAPASTASASVTPTFPPTTTAQASFRCGGRTAFDGVLSQQVGDLLITPSTLAGTALILPANTPLAPFVVQTPITPPSGGMAAANFSSRLPGGYTFAVCNRSTSQTHTVTSVSMRIDRVVPYTGQLSEWPGCTHAYTRSPLPGAVGCGNPLDDYLQAIFPAHPTVGNIATATQVSTSFSGINGYPPPPLSPMPVALAPGQGLIIAVDPVIPGAAATYTFTLGVAVDTAAAAFVSPAPPVLLAPVAHDFTGDACQTAAMQAQIPATTNQVVFYVCPVA